MVPCALSRTAKNKSDEAQRRENSGAEKWQGDAEKTRAFDRGRASEHFSANAAKRMNGRIPAKKEEQQHFSMKK